MSDTPDRPSSTLRWDIFCQVIDNLGDIGVCWRLAADLAQRGHSVRLWLDQPDALHWMAPGLHPNVQVVQWRHDALGSHDIGLPPELGDAVIAAFSCELDQMTLSALGRRARAGRPCTWLNLEYLSAESFSERSHGKAAPVLRGPALGAPRLAYYPGFTPATGGLLCEPGLLQRQAAFDRRSWLERHGVDWHGQRLISMFCYEPALLPALLAQLAQGEHETIMLVCAGRGAQAVRAVLEGDALAKCYSDGTVRPEVSKGIRDFDTSARTADEQYRALARHTSPSPAVRLANLTLHFLPALPQTGYDRLLWACNLNFVRGEDSLVRAIWAGRAFVWQIYPQEDGAHHAKLTALLDRMDAPISLRTFMASWNGMEDGSPQGVVANLGVTEPEQLAHWSAATLAWRQTLLAQPDLSSQLVEMARGAG